MPLNSVSSEELDWWYSNIGKAVNYISNFNPSIEIYSDASSSGWDAVCKGERTHGFWNGEEKKLHINNLELLAVFFGLKCFAEKLANYDILLRVDNSTAIVCTNKKGEIRFPKLNKLSKQIWNWWEERRLWIFASYIRSKDNVDADFESRRLEQETEFSLSTRAFEEIKQKFGLPEIDLFDED